jgi:hypothetical protein
LAWISVWACAAVSSGVDLQPLNSMATPRPAAANIFQFAAFLTFPPFTRTAIRFHFDPLFFSYFHPLSMESSVIPLTLLASCP